MIIDTKPYLYEIANRLGDEQLSLERENQQLFQLLFGSLCYRDQAMMEIDYGIMAMVEEYQQLRDGQSSGLAYREILLRKCFHAWLDAYRKLALEIGDSLILELVKLGCYHGNTLVYSPLFYQEDFKSKMRIEPVYLLHNELHVKGL